MSPKIKMKYYKYILLVAISLIFVTKSSSQHRRYSIKNGIGLQAGISQFDILTDNFETKSNVGFIGGMSSVVDIPHKWYNVSYNITLSENKIDVKARPSESGEDEFVEYKLLTVQLSLLGHIKLIGNNFTLDIGPMLQYNGSLELKNKSKEDYVITGINNLLAGEISNISRFHINGAIGLTAGFGRFAIRGQYIYGFTNILARLNNNTLDTDQKFKGHQSMFTLAALFIL